MSELFLYVYDISKGMAKHFTHALLDKGENN